MATARTSPARAALLASLLMSAMLGFPGASVEARQPAARTIVAPEPFTAATLRARYAANRTAAAEVPATRGLGRPGRQLLGFDRRGGRVAEVFGELATAKRVAVIVPGSDIDLTTFDRPGDKPHASPAGGARAVYREARRLDPGRPLAVIAWLGYDAPSTLSLAVTNDRRARAGAVDLSLLVAGLRRQGVAVSLLCHSYGSVVCAHAVRRAPVTDLVVFGSPGLPFRSAAALGAGRVWATRGSADWIKRVPKLRISLFGRSLGLGRDPVNPSFGAHVFSSGAAGHSDYLRPGSESLRRITEIALGRPAALAGARTGRVDG